MALFHARLANTVVMYVFLISIWGFWRVFRKQGLDSSYWGAVAIAEIIILIQGVLGIIMAISSLVPARGWMHVLYGVVGAISLPAVYFYTKGRESRLEMLVYAAVTLFMVGIFMRAIATGAAG